MLAISGCWSESDEVRRAIFDIKGSGYLEWPGRTVSIIIGPNQPNYSSEIAADIGMFREGDYAIAVGGRNGATHEIYSTFFGTIQTQGVMECSRVRVLSKQDMFGEYQFVECMDEGQRVLGRQNPPLHRTARPTALPG